MVCRSITSSMSYFRCLSLRLRIETDTLEFSELGRNFEEAQAFRASTLDRIRMYLALECTVPDRDTDATQTRPRRSISNILPRWAVQWLSTTRLVSGCLITMAVALSLTLHPTEQRRGLMQQIKFFVDMSEVEQGVQLSGLLPTVESYLRRRRGTSAVAVCLAIHE